MSALRNGRHAVAVETDDAMRSAIGFRVNRLKARMDKDAEEQKRESAKLPEKQKQARKKLSDKISEAIKNRMQRLFLSLFLSIQFNSSSSSCSFLLFLYKINFCFIV